ANTEMWIYAAKGDIARMRAAGERGMLLIPGQRLGQDAFLALVLHDSSGFARLRPEIRRQPDIPAISIAAGDATLHNADSAIVWLNRAYELKSDVLGQVEYGMFDWMRSDPRFEAFAAKYR